MCQVPTFAAGRAAFADPVQEDEACRVVGRDVDDLVLCVVAVCEWLDGVREQQECRGRMQRYRESLGGVVGGVFALEDLGAAFVGISGGLGVRDMAG